MSGTTSLIQYLTSYDGVNPGLNANTPSASTPGYFNYIAIVLHANPVLLLLSDFYSVNKTLKK